MTLPTYGYNYAIVAFVVLSVLFSIFNLRYIKDIPAALKIFTLISLISVIIFPNQENYLKSLCCVTAPLLAYQVGTVCSNRYNINGFNCKSIGTLYVGCLVMLIIGLSKLITNPNMLIFHRDFTFCIIFFIPFLTLWDRKYLRIISILLIVVLVTVSVKRSLLFGLILFYALYTIINLYLNNGLNKARIIIWILVLAIVVTFGFSSFEESTYYEQLDERLSNLNEDGGSGRDEIYENVFNGIIKSDVDQLLLGHGYENVRDTFGILSHNDLLEIAYDFGVIALVFWIATIIVFFRRGLSWIKEKEYLRGSIMISSLIFWQLIAETNCIVVTSNYTALIFLFFGLINPPKIKDGRYKLSQSIYNSGAV